MRYAPFAFALSVLLPLAELAAQQGMLAPGTKVRVTTTEIAFGGASPTVRLVWVVVALKSDTLVVESKGDTLRLPVDSLTKVEASTGRGFRAKEGLKGAGIGLLAGAALGLEVGLEDDEPGVDVRLVATGAVLGAVVGGALLGGGRNARTGGLIGSLVGVPIGVAIGLATYEPCPAGTVCIVGPGLHVFLVAGLVGGAAGLLGLITGAFIPADHWEEVPLDQLRVSVAPQRNNRFGLGLSFAF